MRRITNEEAIEVLEDMKVKVEIPKAAVTQYKRNVALDMAIKSLELFGNSEQLPPAQPERLTDDDFETIRIHLSAHKEKLCNQRRWKEAKEYQRIIDRFMAFASVQPEERTEERTETHACDCISRQDVLGWLLAYHTKSFDLKGRYYPHEVIGWLVTDISKNLFADMRGEQE